VDTSTPKGLELSNYYLDQALWNNPIVFNSSANRIVTIKGKDIYEVLWSTEVSMNKELKKSVVEQIKHIELKFEAV
jgi:predicted oxidoreductase (fatty acid repression mutant protein)